MEDRVASEAALPLVRNYVRIFTLTTKMGLHFYVVVFCKPGSITRVVHAVLVSPHLHSWSKASTHKSISRRCLFTETATELLEEVIGTCKRASKRKTKHDCCMFSICDARSIAHARDSWLTSGTGIHLVPSFTYPRYRDATTKMRLFLQRSLRVAHSRSLLSICVSRSVQRKNFSTSVIMSAHGGEGGEFKPVNEAQAQKLPGWVYLQSHFMRGIEAHIDFVC